MGERGLGSPTGKPGPRSGSKKDTLWFPEVQWVGGETKLPTDDRPSYEKTQNRKEEKGGGGD